MSILLNLILGLGSDRILAHEFIHFSFFLFCSVLVLGRHGTHDQIKDNTEKRREYR